MIDTAEFRRRGLYDPDSPNADDRLALLRWLEHHGVSLDEMVDASKRSRLPALLADRVVRPGDRFERAELAARAGIPLQRVEKIRRAVGFAAPESDVVVFTDGDVKTLRCRYSELSPRKWLAFSARSENNLLNPIKIRRGTGRMPG